MSSSSRSKSRSNSGKTNSKPKDQKASSSGAAAAAGAASLKETTTPEQQQQKQQKQQQPCADGNDNKNKEKTKNDTFDNRPLEINDHCDVLFRGGPEQLRAKIIERRPIHYYQQLHALNNNSNNNDNNKKRKKQQHQQHIPPPRRRESPYYDIPPDAKANDLEYYVHYIHHDRRLDQWVTLDKFVLSTLERQADNTEMMDIATSASGESDVIGTASGGTGTNNITTTSLRRRRSSTNNTTTTTTNTNLLLLDETSMGHPIESTSSTTSTTVDNFLSGGNWHGIRGDSTLEALEREHEETTKVKNIEKIFMGCYEVECWYYSPYPQPYHQAELLYVCEFCLKYMKKGKTFQHHRATCPCRHPPGREIYREYDLSVYEVDGKLHRVYCQNLCLLAKLFLDHKTLYYDVDPFYFYVITQVDDSGAHIVGYFSKEKISAEEYNLACILTFPQYQQHGYGKFIISLSYELTKRENKTGSPEKPLSDLGKISYRSYWTHILLHLLSQHDPTQDLTIRDISIQTGIKTEDIISTLQYLDMIKCWKGQHVVFVKQNIIDDYMKQE